MYSNYVNMCLGGNEVTVESIALGYTIGHSITQKQVNVVCFHQLDSKQCKNSKLPMNSSRSTDLLYTIFRSLHSRKLHILGLRARTVCTSSRVIFFFSLSDRGTYHFCRRSFPCLLNNSMNCIWGRQQERGRWDEMNQEQERRSDAFTPYIMSHGKYMCMYIYIKNHSVSNVFSGTESCKLISN